MSRPGGFNLTANNRRAVLLFHGLTGSPFEMRYYGGKLHKMGYDVYCPCLPGHCTSIEDLKSKKWRDWDGFGKAEFEKLAASYDEVYLSGLCLGALLCMSIAIDSDSPRALALLSPTLALDGWSIPWFRFLIILAFTPVGEMLDYSFVEREPYGVKNEHVRKRVISLLASDSMSAYDRYPSVTFAELLRYSKYIRKNIGRVKTPAIILHPEEDDICDLRNARHIYDRIGSGMKELNVLKNSYHIVTIDNEKDLVAEKTIEFFSAAS
ncbi:MAG TPA: alpha/beta fold hydrolase, partial [Thermodesulfobacteriota bacterium]|nr:alpha/beta fold hydrolase [Thermodesulfobacteriota bacterium]